MKLQGVGWIFELKRGKRCPVSGSPLRAGFPIILIMHSILGVSWMQVHPSVKHADWKDFKEVGNFLIRAITLTVQATCKAYLKDKLVPRGTHRQ